MKAYVFGIGVLLMLSSSLAGMSYTAVLILRRTSGRFGRLAALGIGAIVLCLLIAALAWSVPPREVA
jgi:hypothetical protein